MFTKIIAISFIAVCINSCAEQQKPNKAANIIYLGGDIITMNDEQPDAEAIAINGGNIHTVGTKTHVEKFKGNATKTVDLSGKTLLPGFIDAHSHYISSLKVANQVKLFMHHPPGQTRAPRASLLNS